MTDAQDIQGLLKHLITGTPLEEDDAFILFQLIMSGQATPAQVGSVLTAIQCRTGGASIPEITGAARAMRLHARKVAAPDNLDLIDTCGTGGDGTKTFNISTCAAIIAAGAGAAVAKHGNRSVTSNSGSSQVLEALGINLMVTDDGLTKCLEEAGICFCFAPAHHPAMKHAIGPRRELGFRTIFNVLGPLTNPAGASRQVLGVWENALTEKLAYVLQGLGAARAMVVHGSGLDEITTTGSTHISEIIDGSVYTRDFHPKELDIPVAHIDDLKVAGVDDSANVIRSVLDGKTGPARDIACLNAGAALVVAGKAEALDEGYAQAMQAIDSGKAGQALETLARISHEAKV